MLSKAVPQQNYATGEKERTATDQSHLGSNSRTSARARSPPSSFQETARFTQGAVAASHALPPLALPPLPPLLVRLRMERWRAIAGSWRSASATWSPTSSSSSSCAAVSSSRAPAAAANALGALGGLDPSDAAAATEAEGALPPASTAADDDDVDVAAATATARGGASLRAGGGGVVGGGGGGCCEESALLGAYLASLPSKPPPGHRAAASETLEVGAALARVFSHATAFLSANGGAATAAFGGAGGTTSNISGGARTETAAATARGGRARATIARASPPRAQRARPVLQTRDGLSVVDFRLVPRTVVSKRGPPLERHRMGRMLVLRR